MKPFTAVMGACRVQCRASLCSASCCSTSVPCLLTTCSVSPYRSWHCIRHCQPGVGFPTEVGSYGLLHLRLRLSAPLCLPAGCLPDPCLRVHLHRHRRPESHLLVLVHPHSHHLRRAVYLCIHCVCHWPRPGQPQEGEGCTTSHSSPRSCVCRLGQWPPSRQPSEVLALKSWAWCRPPDCLVNNQASYTDCLACVPVLSRCGVQIKMCYQQSVPSSWVFLQPRRCMTAGSCTCLLSHVHIHINCCDMPGGDLACLVMIWAQQRRSPPSCRCPRDALLTAAGVRAPGH